MSDYKSTLNLPETGFPMRGDLAKREPGMLRVGLMMICTASSVRLKKAKKPSFCMMALLKRMAAFILVTRLTRF